MKKFAYVLGLTTIVTAPTEAALITVGAGETYEVTTSTPNMSDYSGSTGVTNDALLIQSIGTSSNTSTVNVAEGVVFKNNIRKETIFSSLRYSGG